ncbi:glycosyltransferase family 2 protein [Providencia stuartii]|uniref:glycosyltransferase family 2 protein n=1 Tax=Providencia stuartii TaxID=588 RepID=UPI00300C3670
MAYEPKDYILSIIIPVFNRENSIAILLERLLKLVPEDIEFVLVNDGSTDSTLDAIKQIVENSKKIGQVKIVNHQKNLGVSAARNTGLEQATGYYLGFIDSDDLVTSNYFEVLRPLLLKYEYDIISFNFTYQDKVIKSSNDGSQLEGVFTASHWHLVSRVYKRELFKDKKFEVLRRYEDVILLPYIFINAKKIKHINEVLYHYIQTKQSITQQIKISDIDDLYFALNKALYYIENYANSTESRLFTIYLFKIMMLIRKYIRKINGYYAYNIEYYDMAKRIIGITEKYNNSLGLNIKKLKYAKIDSYISKLKYWLTLKKKGSL